MVPFLTACLVQALELYSELNSHSMSMYAVYVHISGIKAIQKHTSEMTNSEVV